MQVRRIVKKVDMLMENLPSSVTVIANVGKKEKEANYINSFFFLKSRKLQRLLIDLKDSETFIVSSLSLI